MDKKIKYINRFEDVKIKLRDLEDRDKIKNWQPPIDGKEIMETFNIKPCKEVGILKESIKNAILDGIITNDYNSARTLMIKKGIEIGLKINK